MINYEKYDLDSEIEKIIKLENTTRMKAGNINCYGNSHILSEMYNIPKEKYIEAYIYPGINVSDDYQHRTDLDMPTLCTRKSEALKAKERRPERNDIFYSGSAMPMYRRFKKIEQSKNAKGTIAFPAHSSKSTNFLFSWDEYAENLKKLPEEFQPVDICCYYFDILEGKHQVFLNKGFKVYTAGHKLDDNFCDNFYEIARHYKYSTTNTFAGSNSFYTAEMGLKTFIYGDENRSVEEIFSYSEKLDKEQEKKSNAEIYEYFAKVFPTYPQTEMTPKQKDMVIKIMGLDEQSPKKDIRKALLEHSKKIASLNTKTKSKWEEVPIFKYRILNKLFKIEKLNNRRRLKIFNFISISYKTKKNI